MLQDNIFIRADEIFIENYFLFALSSNDMRRKR